VRVLDEMTLLWFWYLWHGVFFTTVLLTSSEANLNIHATARWLTIFVQEYSVSYFKRQKEGLGGYWKAYPLLAIVPESSVVIVVGFTPNTQAN
jgi:hypothetical protein